LYFFFFFFFMLFLISGFLFLFYSYYTQWISIGIRYWWLLFFLWPCIKWLHKWLHCNEKLLVNIRIWWMQCCVSWSLLTWHQEFATYESMKGAMGYLKNQLLRSISKNMFWQRTKLSYDTFHSLIRVVSPSLERKHYFWN
jgi:hypothetical protein